MHLAVEFLPASAAGFRDRSEPDASTPDPSTPDARTPDGSTPDGSTPDALRLRALAGRPRPLGLGLLVPRRAEDITLPPPLDPGLIERAELVEALRRLFERSTSSDRSDRSGRDDHRDDRLARTIDGATSALARLARDDACVVVCGQQPGFCGGPLLDALKTLHTIRLARELERHFARPMVPLYWNHGDDADAVEVQGVHLVNANFDVAKVGLFGFGASRTPLYERRVERVTHALDAARSALEGLLPGASRNAELLELLLPRDGETLVGARTRAWYRLFGHHGLLVLEPDALRAAHGRALARVVLAGPHAALEAASERLHHAGLRPGAHAPSARAERADVPPPALLFQLHRGARAEPAASESLPSGVTRRAVRPRADGRWRIDGEDVAAERTSEELAAAVRAEPEAWSAGVLLRPLVQDALLPVAAYVGGPGELAYHVQLAELRAAAGLPDTPFVPRVHACVSTPALRFAAQKLGRSVVRILTDGETDERSSASPAERATRDAATDDAATDDAATDDAATDDAATDDAATDNAATDDAAGARLSGGSSETSSSTGSSDVDVSSAARDVRDPDSGAALTALADRLAATTARHSAELLAHRAALAELDRGLAQQLRRTVAENTDRFAQLVRKLRRVADNRRGKLRRHRRRVTAMLRPLGRPQERVLGLAAFLSAAGMTWLDGLLEELDPFPTENLLVHLGRDVEDPPARDIEGWL